MPAPPVHKFPPKDLLKRCRNCSNWSCGNPDQEDAVGLCLASELRVAMKPDEDCWDLLFKALPNKRIA